MIQLLSHFRVRAHKRIFLPRKLFVLLTHQHTQGVCPGQIRGGHTAVDRGGWCRYQNRKPAGQRSCEWVDLKSARDVAVLAAHDRTRVRERCEQHRGSTPVKHGVATPQLTGATWGHLG